MSNEPIRSARYVRFLCGLLVTGFCAALMLLLPLATAAQEPDVRVVLGIDRSASMAHLGSNGHGRIIAYVSKVLFEGFALEDVTAPDVVVVPYVASTMPARDQQTLAQGLASLDGDIEVYWYGFDVVEKGHISSSSEFGAVYPSMSDLGGGTRLADALAHALGGMDAARGIQSTYWVNISDDILDVGDPEMDAEQRKAILQLRDAYPSRLILSFSVEENGRTVLVTVEQFFSRAQVLAMHQSVTEALPKIEDKLDDPRISSSDILSEIAQLRSQVDALQSTLDRIGEKVYGTDIAAVQQEIVDMRQRIQNLEILLMAPGSFTLREPLPGAQVAEGDVVFRWDQAERSQSYELLLQHTGEEPVAIRSAGSDNEIVQTLAAGSYRWMVRAIGAREDLVVDNEGGWQDLLVQESVGPVSLLEPQDGCEQLAVETAFSWSAAEGADSYELVIQETGQPAQRYGTQGLSYVLSMTEGSYTWWVEALNANGSVRVPSTEKRRLNVLGSPAREPFEVISPLQRPVLRPGEVVFAWTQLPAAISYTLVITPLRGTENVIQKTLAENQLVLPLEKGIYAWSVAATDGSGETWRASDTPIRFSVVPKTSFPWGVLFLLLTIALAAVCFVRLQEPIRIELRRDSGTPESKEFVLGLNQYDNRVYLGRRDDGEPFYDLGVPDAYLERKWFKGVRLYHAEGSPPERVRWGDTHELKRSEYDVVRFVVARASKGVESGESVG